MTICHQWNSRGRTVIKCCCRRAWNQEDVVTGTISINSIFFSVLFDTSATNYFISISAVKRLGLLNLKSTNVQISLPSSTSVSCFAMFENINIEIEKVNFPSTLFKINLQDLDVILGRDWLSKYSAIVDCGKQRV